MAKHTSKKKKQISWQADPNQVCIPSENDVLCGRGLVAFRHVGNERLRNLVAEAVPLFATATCRYEKSRIVLSLVQRVLDGGGRFLTRLPKSDVWHLAGFKRAREKVSHALRDAASDKVKCMRGLVLTRMWDATTVPSDDTLLEDTTGPKNEHDLKVTQTRRTTTLVPAKSRTDGSCNHFNFDTMALMSMTRPLLAFTVKDVARSIEIMELLTSL